MRGEPRVLVIEDRPDHVDRLRAALTSCGWRSLFAATGDDALWGLDEDPPECVAIDLTAPVLDGWFVLAQLGARTARPRLVAFTPHLDDADRARELGADAVVAQRADLVDAIASMRLTAIA